MLSTKIPWRVSKVILDFALGMQVIVGKLSLLRIGRRFGGLRRETWRCLICDRRLRFCSRMTRGGSTYQFVKSYFSGQRMDIEPLEVYARDSNYAIIKPPGRNYPGCVIQGDSLASLGRMAKATADFAAKAGISDEDFLRNVEELNNALVGRLLHYQQVLSRHGIDFPHVHAFDESDFIELIPKDGGD